LGVGFRVSQGVNERVQLRPAIVPPRGEVRSDIELVFDLAIRLALGEYFWQGDVEAGLTHYLAPSGITLAQLREAPRGMRIPLEATQLKYRRSGFATSSGKLEIYSEALQAIRQPPLPVGGNPAHSAARGEMADERFPLVLTSTKTPVYCHSQDRNLPRLRRALPEPIAEINPATAAARYIAERDWIAIVTPLGPVRARARLVASLAEGVVGAQHGWWQDCKELALPDMTHLARMAPISIW
jgi:anaerobic selenocysteine-containing dehydrogenase